MPKKKNLVEEAHEFYCEMVFARMKVEREKKEAAKKQRDK